MSVNEKLYLKIDEGFPGLAHTMSFKNESGTEVIGPLSVHEFILETKEPFVQAYTGIELYNSHIGSISAGLDCDCILMRKGMKYLGKLSFEVDVHSGVDTFCFIDHATGTDLLEGQQPVYYRLIVSASDIPHFIWCDTIQEISGIHKLSQKAFYQNMVETYLTISKADNIDWTALSDDQNKQEEIYRGIVDKVVKETKVGESHRYELDLSKLSQKELKELSERIQKEMAPSDKNTLPDILPDMPNVKRHTNMVMSNREEVAWLGKPVEFSVMPYEGEDLSKPLPNSIMSAVALYGFMGWLTSRQERSGPFSGHDSATQGANLVEKFCKSQGWEIPRDMDGSWTGLLKPFPKD